MRVIVAAALLALLALALWAASSALHSGPDAPDHFGDAGSSTAFVERAQAAGFAHVHHKPALDPVLEPIMNWVASVGAAAAAGDFDGDGLVDLYVTDSDKGRPNYLYKNRGDGTFVDVAAAAGVAHVNDDGGVSMDCVFGDYDNDGWLDLYLVKWGRDQLFRNQHGGTFRDVTAQAFRDEHGNPGAPWANGCAALWFDYDGDARLDLYVGNYFAPFDLWNLEHTRILHDSFEHSRNAGRNSLYRNRGDGTFEDVGAKLAVDDCGWTLAVGHGDVDNDGWPDLYVANDFGPDKLFLNNADGTFRDVSERVIGKDTRKGMNVDFGDWDNDGWLDIQVSNITTADYLKEGNFLWHNLGLGSDGLPHLIDAAADMGVWEGGWGWGAKWLDYDHDGDLDLIGLTGFVTDGEGDYWYDLASWTVTGKDSTDALEWPPMGHRSFSGNDPTRLWRNDERRHFKEVAARAGLDDRRDGRGVVVFDPDGDGDLDLYFANQGQPPSYWLNAAGAAGHWLQLRLIGRVDAAGGGSNRQAIGARVSLQTSAGLQVRELDGGNGYCGHSDGRLHFGLGDEAVVRTLEIRWPSRRVQVLRDVRADRLLVVEEPEQLAEASSLIPHERTAVPPPIPAAVIAPEIALPPAERDALLTSLEQAVRRQPDDPALASRYRAQCVRLAEHERSVSFFERLAGEIADSRNVRLQLAAAYIDQIPTCGGVAAVVCKGTLARRSLDQLDQLLRDDPEWWPALYCRAMNHLHWPRALRHSAASATDFEHCVAIQESAGEPAAQPHFVRSYIGLGDARAKDGDFDGALAAWKAGLAVFPGDAALRERAALRSLDEASAYVAKTRSLEQPIDTDFSFLLGR